MQIGKASEPDREKIAEIITDGFYDHDAGLKFFTRNKEKFKKFIANALLLEHFYIAVIDNEIAGAVGCTNKRKKQFSLSTDIKIYIKIFGFKGIILWFMLVGGEKYIKPKTNEKTGVFDIVGTSAKHQRMGVASAIIRHIFSLPEYDNYMLEVADTNTSAIKLYKKLGFTEESRRKFFQKSGINHFVYMRYWKG